MYSLDHGRWKIGPSHCQTWTRYKTVSLYKTTFKPKRTARKWFPKKETLMKGKGKKDV